jgi:hypothetical protein
LAGRLPPQAEVRVRAGGRAAATPAGDDFKSSNFHPNVGERSAFTGNSFAKIAAIEIAPLSHWLVACLRRRKCASAQADARRQRPAATISNRQLFIRTLVNALRSPGILSRKSPRLKSLY